MNEKKDWITQGQYQKLIKELADIKDCLEDHIKRIFKVQGQIGRIQKRLRDIEATLDKKFGETWRE